MAEIPDIILDRTVEQLTRAIDKVDGLTDEEIAHIEQTAENIDAFGKVRIGNQATAVTSAVAIGTGAIAEEANSVAIGKTSKTEEAKGIAIGYYAASHNENGIAIGYNSSVLANGAIQIGEGTNRTANTVKIKDTTLLNASGKIPSSIIEGGGGTSYTLGDTMQAPDNVLDVKNGGIDTAQLKDGAVTVKKIDSNAIPTLTGRQSLNLKDNVTGHAGTVNDPVRLRDITAGFYDIVNGGYICTNPSGANPNARKRELPTGGWLYTDGTWAGFIDIDGNYYLVDVAGTTYKAWGGAIHIDYDTLNANLALFLSKAEAELDYATKTYVNTKIGDIDTALTTIVSGGGVNGNS